MLFDRSISLTVGATLIKGLDFDFQVEKNLGEEPNSAAIDIWNLNPANRKILSASKETPAVLEVGYMSSASSGQAPEDVSGAENLAMLFKGDMHTCVHQRDGTNWKTSLRYGDGKKALLNAKLGKNYAAGTPLREILKDIAGTLVGVDTNDAIDGLVSANLPGLAKSMAISGSSLQEMNRLLMGHNLKASIQDGILHIEHDGAPKRKKHIVLDKQSGLISQSLEGNDGSIKFKSLLRADLRPGCRVFLNEQSYVLTQIRCSGSNYRDDWYVCCDAKLIK